MSITDFQSPAEWRVSELTDDQSWRFTIDDASRTHLATVVKAAYDPDRSLFDYSRQDFDFGTAAAPLAAAVKEALDGRGLAMLHGLPRDDLSEKEFELLNWAIGLHIGVARPQGKASQYISAVRDVGTNYRSAAGRGFSSNAGLDFHVDGGDLTTLGCYNTAKSGGQSMVSSSVTALRLLQAERPDLAEIAYQNFYFSRQQEEAADEAAFYAQPLFAECDGQIFGKWNRNRVRTAQAIDGVPALSPKQQETGLLLDDILQRPEVMFTLHLAPGDLQIINNHTMLHSRTAYEDFEAPERKRLLCRLWLALPGSATLPDSWGDFYRSVEAGSVRGGIRGHHHDAACQAFDLRQAMDHGMPAPRYLWPSQC